MKQTAVEFLAEKYDHINWLRNRDEISAGRADKMRNDAYEQAKEMEKEQIMDAYTAGESDGDHYKDSYLRYYNETFNTNEK